MTDTQPLFPISALSEHPQRRYRHSGTLIPLPGSPEMRFDHRGPIRISGKGSDRSGVSVMSGAISGSLFLEDLPDQCPPSHAQPLAERLLIRLAETSTPSVKAFLSYAALGKPVKGGATPCQYSSCSLIEGVENKEQVQALRLLPKFQKFTHAFITRITPAAGPAVIGRKGHVDLWFYRSFDVVSAVEAVEPL